MYLKKLLLLFFIFSSAHLIAQQYTSKYQNHQFRHYDRYLYNADNRFHTSVKPFLYSQYDTIVDVDSLYAFNHKRKIWNILFDKSLISFKASDTKKHNILKNQDFMFTIDPVLQFEYGKDPEFKENSSINTRGILVNASLRNKISISTSYWENQVFFNDYRDSLIKNISVIPGQGKPKRFKENGYDYGYAEAYISFTPSENFNFQFGNGKNFFGDGYRSLLLSDNAFSYPYFKITTDVWNIKYVLLWAQFQDLNSRRTYESGYEKKWGAFHYLDWSVTKWLNFAFFESVIWQNQDSTGYRGFDLSYANPVILYRPAEYANGSPDNSLLGFNLKLTLWKQYVFYGQLLLDEFKLNEFFSGNNWWANKYAIQGGFKSYDIFKLKNLDIQTEINYVRPFTYSHLNNLQNYGHYNEALAHPMGSNFVESVSFIRYNIKRIFLEGRFSYAIHGTDTAGYNYGNNIFEPYTTRSKEYGYELGGAEPVNVIFTSFNVSYLVNPATNLNIYFTYINRKESGSFTDKNQNFIAFGIRTSLNNFYFDY